MGGFNGHLPDKREAGNWLPGKETTEADVERGVVVWSGRAAGDRLVLFWTLQKTSASLGFCP